MEDGVIVVAVAAVVIKVVVVVLRVVVAVTRYAHGREEAGRPYRLPFAFGRVRADVRPLSAQCKSQFPIERH